MGSGAFANGELQRHDDDNGGNGDDDCSKSINFYCARIKSKPTTCLFVAEDVGYE